MASLPLRWPSTDRQAPPDPTLGAVKVAPGALALTSAHVQGSCRIGLNADVGVVDQNLKLHNLDNIYVVDGSVMPTTASTHTMIPIMVMADRAMHKLLHGA